MKTTRNIFIGLLALLAFNVFWVLLDRENIISENKELKKQIDSLSLKYHELVKEHYATLNDISSNDSVLRLIIQDVENTHQNILRDIEKLSK